MTSTEPTALEALAERAPWPLPCRVLLGDRPVAERAEAAAEHLPARPGVVVVTHDGAAGPEPIAVLASGDLKSFARNRLGGDGAQRDLAPLADGLLACPAGSGFEADWAQAVLACAWTPDAHARALETNRWWWLELDPEGDLPVCRVRDRIDGRADPGTVIGPFASRSGAEAFGAGLDDRFELCREPPLLAQRPNAVACAYKEMGKCPAPCDGSEPMEAYRARARAALSFAGEPRGGARARIEKEIAEASAALEFERAAALRGELETLDAFNRRGAEWATTLDRFGVLAVLPSGRKGWARLVIATARGVAHAVDVEPADAAGVVGPNLERWTRHARSGVPGVSMPAASALAVVCGRVFSRRSTRSSYLRLEPRPQEADVVRAIRRASRVAIDEADQDERPAHGTETGGAP